MTVVYQCTACDTQFHIPGEYRYYPQAGGHWHVPDTGVAWQVMLFDHYAGHGGRGAVTPITPMPS